MKKILLSLVLLVGCATAQLPRNNSFTPDSAYEKESVRYPFITVARPQLPPDIAEQRNLVYAAYGQRKLRLDIFYPRQAEGKKYPAVVMIHGGGWRSGDRSMEIPLAHRLAAQGYITVAVEYRLSPEARYPAAVHDIKAALRWLRAHAEEYSVDPDRVALSGESAGGQLAALVAYTNGIDKFEGGGGNADHSSTVQAMIDIDGILDFISEEARKHEDDPAKNPSSAGAWFGGRYEEKPELWQEASPLYYVNEKSPPTLFINSSIPRFHVGRDEVIQKLRQHGIHYEIHTFADTPHPFWLFNPWFEPTVQHMVKFLDRVFKE